MPEETPGEILLRTEDEHEIADALAAHDVEFRRWPLRAGVAPGMPQDEVLAVYREEITALCQRDSLVLVDVAQLCPEDTPQWREHAAVARSAFLEEHRHAEDEVRYFARGVGCFYLHLDNRVYAVVCTAGDQLSVPSGTRHWFDMGPRPDFTAIRFFKEEDGWVGDFTGDTIARRFPRLDELTEPRR
jgi:1,2-dihydroxy-3-keto-5-methylthiopentene dioxygenase